MKFPAQMSLGRKKRRAEEAVLEQHSFAYSTVSEIKPGIQRNVEIPPPAPDFKTTWKWID